jgi:putative serine protease PepD
VTNIANQLISTGKVTNSGRASLGITARTVADEAGQAAGVGVISVTPEGGAAAAGLRAGDVIVGVSGEKTPDVATLNALLAQLKPGQQVEVKYLRQGGTSVAKVTLGTLTS